MRKQLNHRHVKLDDLMENNKTLILAYDQGFEHGPEDFNLKNIDPEYVFNIALEGKFNAFAVQPGIAEKYHVAHYKDIKLIIKLNGKTKFSGTEPVSRQHTSVQRALDLGAVAVGYTIYLGSKEEQTMFTEFGKIVEEAHSVGLPVICWMYPRGSAIHNDLSTDILAYATRIAAELGADIVKIKFNGDIEGMKWVIKAAGRTKVVIAGGEKMGDLEVLKYAEAIMKSGASGLAIGRNVWQNDKPFEITKALKQVVFHNNTAEEAFYMMRK